MRKITLSKKEGVLKRIVEFVGERYEKQAEIAINTFDEKGRGIAGCYLTVTGTSADSGDSGQVGRGNRVNGLISLNRAAGSEAGAGKNCVSHIGKIYNLLAYKMANEIYRATGKENYVWLTSQIGTPVDQPHVVYVEIDEVRGKDKDEAKNIVEKNFRQLSTFLSGLLKGKYRTV